MIQKCQHANKMLTRLSKKNKKNICTTKTLTYVSIIYNCAERYYSFTNKREKSPVLIHQDKVCVKKKSNVSQEQRPFPFSELPFPLS